MNGSRKVLVMVELAILLAIEIIMALTPLGSIPIGPLVATLAHIPPIVAAIVIGPAGGAFMGFAFGLLSFLVWTLMPPSPITAFIFTPAYPPGNFWSIVICFVPRILLGLVAAYLFKWLMGLKTSGKLPRLPDIVPYALSAILASLLHTVLVLGGIYVFFGEAYAKAVGAAFSALFAMIMGVVTTNGILEAVLAGVCAWAICKPINSFVRNKE